MRVLRPGPAPRIYCEAALTPGATVILPERGARHVAALRLKVNDAITLFSGDGHESAATLVGVGRRGATATVRSRAAVDRESPLVVDLAQGVCASDKMDLLIQKATELGVGSIQPLVTQRSIVRLSDERRERREIHWQHVAIAACEQCGRNRIPSVASTLSLTDFLGRPAAGDTRLLLSPSSPLTLRDLSARGPMTVLVGPEGGLAPEEHDQARAAGFIAVGFGPRIMRAETAPLAALAALQALYGDC